MAIGFGSKSIFEPISLSATSRILVFNFSLNRTIPPGKCQPSPQYRSFLHAKSVSFFSFFKRRSTLTKGVILLTKRNSSSGKPSAGLWIFLSRIAMASIMFMNPLINSGTRKSNQLVNFILLIERNFSFVFVCEDFSP